jgi:hypothetical protein
MGYSIRTFACNPRRQSYNQEFHTAIRSSGDHGFYRLCLNWFGMVPVDEFIGKAVVLFSSMCKPFHPAFCHTHLKDGYTGVLQNSVFSC